jgi:hypothetical protein
MPKYFEFFVPVKKKSCSIKIKIFTRVFFLLFAFLALLMKKPTIHEPTKPPSIHPPHLPFLIISHPSVDIVDNFSLALAGLQHGEGFWVVGKLMRWPGRNWISLVPATPNTFYLCVSPVPDYLFFL